MGVPWIKKYSPEKLDSVVAQDSQMSVLKNYIENYKNQKKKAMVLYGPSGCGKTCSAYALADELGLDVIELNASDLRNKDQINSVVGAASKQMSLFGKGKLILIDELDGIAGRKDYGGIPALVKIILESYFPIIITATNPYDNKFSSIRNKSELLQFKSLEAEDIFILLKRISDLEKIKYDETALKKIARRTGGDARAAINDLEIVSNLGEVRDRKSVV